MSNSSFAGSHSLWAAIFGSIRSSSEDGLDVSSSAVASRRAPSVNLPSDYIRLLLSPREYVFHMYTYVDCCHSRQQDEPWSNLVARDDACKQSLTVPSVMTKDEEL